MERVLTEVLKDDKWVKLGTLCSAEPPGSIGSYEDGIMQLYIFGWIDSVGPCVWKSIGGSSLENTSIRKISSLGLLRLADLGKGPYDLNRVFEGGFTVKMRFSKIS